MLTLLRLILALALATVLYVLSFISNWCACAYSLFQEKVWLTNFGYKGRVFPSAVKLGYWMAEPFDDDPAAFLKSRT